MRIAEVKASRERYSGEVQSLPEGDISDSVDSNFHLAEGDSAKRRLMRAVALSALKAQQRSVRKRFNLPRDFSVDLYSIGERFADDAAWSIMLENLPAPMEQLEVLVPGCYMGNEDVQFWLRRGVRSLYGIDIYSLERSWRSILPQLADRWNVPVDFVQGSIEKIPFEDERFDVITTSAVLEHVRNLDAMVAESARVLRPGGLAFHSFGPLYHTFGGDHCIAAYGSDCGFDHLLLDDGAYQQRIRDESFFAMQLNQPDLPSWAKREQFSFARPADYIRAFSARFEMVYTGAKISAQALAFRLRHSAAWQAMLDAGVAESDLLIKSLVLIVRKPRER